MSKIKSPTKAGTKAKKFKHNIPVLCLFAALILLWQGLCTFEIVPTFMLPSPYKVGLALVSDRHLLWMHAQTSLIEAALGLVFGVGLGFVIACLMERFQLVNDALQPLITVSQTIPTVAIAPLLVLWMGYGMLPKVVLVVLSMFFPITVSLIRGFRSTDPDVIDLMRTMKATRLQIFFNAKLPAAANQFFSGLRIGATYAIVGAVVAEWLGGQSGLGVYMTRVRKSFAYDKMFAVIILISLLSLALMYLVNILEDLCVPWQNRKEDDNEN